MLGSPWDMPVGLPKTVRQESHGEGAEGIRDQGEPGSPDTGRQLRQGGTAGLHLGLFVLSYLGEEQALS